MALRAAAADFGTPAPLAEGRPGVNFRTPGQWWKVTER